MASIARVTGVTTLVLCIHVTCCNPVSSDVCFTQGLSANGGLAQNDNGFVRGCKNECPSRTPQIHVISLQNPSMYRIFEMVTLNSTYQVQAVLVLISDNAVEWRITADQVNITMAHIIQTNNSSFHSRVLWLTQMPGALSTHQIQIPLHTIYKSNWSKDALQMLYDNLKQKQNLKHVSSMNVLKSTFDIVLTIGKKCSTMNETANDGAETGNTLAVVVGLVVLFVIIIVLSIVAGCFFYRQKRKRPHVAQSAKPNEFIKSPIVTKTELADIKTDNLPPGNDKEGNIDPQPASLTSDKDGPYEEYYVEGAEEEAPVIPPRDVNDSEKGGAEGKKTVPVIQTCNDNGFDEESVKCEEDVSTTPPAAPQKDGDESDGDGIYEEAAPVIPPEILSRENRA